MIKRCHTMWKTFVLALGIVVAVAIGCYYVFFLPPSVGLRVVQRDHITFYIQPNHRIESLGLVTVRDEAGRLLWSMVPTKLAADPVACRYGTVPPGWEQRVPEGVPEALESKRKYSLCIEYGFGYLGAASADSTCHVFEVK